MQKIVATVFLIFFGNTLLAQSEKELVLAFLKDCDRLRFIRVDSLSNCSYISIVDTNSILSEKIYDYKHFKVRFERDYPRCTGTSKEREAVLMSWKCKVMLVKIEKTKHRFKVYFYNHLLNQGGFIVYRYESGILKNVEEKVYMF